MSGASTAEHGITVRTITNARLAYPSLDRLTASRKALGAGYGEGAAKFSASLKMPTDVYVQFARQIGKARKHMQREQRKRRAAQGWWNWYHNRNRLAFDAPNRELRMISHRRCL